MDRSRTASRANPGKRDARSQAATARLPADEHGRAGAALSAAATDSSDGGRARTVSERSRGGEGDGAAGAALRAATKTAARAAPVPQGPRREAAHARADSHVSQRHSRRKGAVVLLPAGRTAGRVLRSDAAELTPRASGEGSRRDAAPDGALPGASGTGRQRSERRETVPGHLQQPPASGSAGGFLVQ